MLRKKTNPPLLSELQCGTSASSTVANLGYRTHTGRVDRNLYDVATDRQIEITALLSSHTDGTHTRLIGEGTHKYTRGHKGREERERASLLETTVVIVKLLSDFGSPHCTAVRCLWAHSFLVYAVRFLSGAPRPSGRDASQARLPARRVPEACHLAHRPRRVSAGFSPHVGG